MRRLLGAGVPVFIFTLLFVTPVGAITFGEPDEGRHPNVGMMLVETEEGFFQFCSGSLIAPDVFLTASHCAPGEQIRGHDVLAVYVTFDETFQLVDVEPPIFVDPSTLTLIEGAFVIHEEFGPPQSSPADIAVILLEQSASSVYPGIQPVQLPELGLLDELKAEHELRNQIFTNVGYGVLEAQVGGGPPSFEDSLMRMMSISTFNALTKHWLHLSQNPSTGDAGTCYGDSGGPQFLGGPESNLVVSITVTGDALCRATNVTYRLDSVEAQEFLGQFVTLP